MSYRLGRFLQVLGLLIIPIGMAGNILYKDTIRESHMLLTALIGSAMVGLGWYIQGRGPLP